MREGNVQRPGNDFTLPNQGFSTVGRKATSPQNVEQDIAISRTGCRWWKASGKKSGLEVKWRRLDDFLRWFNATTV